MSSVVACALVSNTVLMNCAGVCLQPKMSPTSTDEDVAEEEEEEEEEPAEQDAVSFLFSVKRKASIG